MTKKELKRYNHLDNYYSLGTLLEQIRLDGLEDHLHLAEFVLNYDACYYESDHPSISVVFYTEDKDVKQKKQDVQKFKI